MPFFKPADNNPDNTDRRLRRLEAWVWICIYGGLLMLVLGAFVQRQTQPLGCGLMAAGVAITVVGAVLLYLRSRIPNK
jgi:hypothetical protein